MKNAQATVVADAAKKKTAEACGSKCMEEIEKIKEKNKVIEKLGSGLASALDWTTTRLGGNTPQKGKEDKDVEQNTFPDVPST